MAKPKKSKNKRELRKLSIKSKIQIKSKQAYSIETKTIRKEYEIELRKSFLIVCEGQTEASFFMGLRVINKLDASKIKILPEEECNNGMSIKTLLYTAMKMQKKAKIPYDEVWIVPDNDENNSLILSDNLLKKISEIVPTVIFQKLVNAQKHEMNVREIDDKERIRYFLCSLEYKNFLKNKILSNAEQNYIPSIIDCSLESKNNELDFLFENKRASFFYDNNNIFLGKNNKGEAKYLEKYFNTTILKNIKVAYSCISFENWLLLHFERTKHPFYNSREILKYFDDKEYFIEENNKFEKGWYLYKNRDLKTVRSFFQLTNQAIRNNLWLIAEMQHEINLGKKFYEVNPFSNVCYLAARLFNTRLIMPNESLDYNELKNITVSTNSFGVKVSFTYDRKKTAMNKELVNCFNIININGRLINTKKSCTHQILRQGNENIKIELKFNTGYISFLNYEETFKNEKSNLIFYCN